MSARLSEDLTKTGRAGVMPKGHPKSDMTFPITLLNCGSFRQMKERHVLLTRKLSRPDESAQHTMHST